jgi:hypothetical protein
MHIMGTAGTVLPLLCACAMCHDRSVWAGWRCFPTAGGGPFILEALFFARYDPLDSPIIYVHVHDMTVRTASHSGKR